MDVLSVVGSTDLWKGL